MKRLADLVRAMVWLLRTFVLAGMKGLTDEFKAMADFAERVSAGEVGVPFDEAALHDLLVNYWGLDGWSGVVGQA